jgi:hypothetical protein
MDKTTELLTVFSQNYLKGYLKTWNACRELYVVSDGDFFEGVACKC